MLPSLVSYRIQILTNLKNLFQSQDTAWLEAKEKASVTNNWFTLSNIDKAISQICEEMLDEAKLSYWIEQYPTICRHPSNGDITAGLIMAGNIPLVGFHDFLCLFVAGFSMKIKLSVKDSILWNFIIEKIKAWEPTLDFKIETAEMLKDCDLYIATGSNNSSRYFEAYFSKYPHIIRKNRTSVAILDGTETSKELEMLKEDMSDYFGLGCRNVSKIYVPATFDFGKLIPFFDNDDKLTQHNKYKNNYDYYYAIYLLNQVKHYAGNNVLFIESTEPFAPVASIHYEFYEISDKASLIENLENDVNIQAIVVNNDNNTSNKCVSIGRSQSPALDDYADGVDTMAFLSQLILVKP